MLIRQATTEDYKGLCAILDEVDALHQTALPHLFRDPGGPARSRAYIASIVEDKNACLWIAEHEEQIIGILHITIRETHDIPILVPRRYAAISTIAVSHAHRRKGIGRALLETAEHWARAKNATQIELHVWEFNEGARAFYEALGYRTASRRMWRRLSTQEASIKPDNP